MAEKENGERFLSLGKPSSHIPKKLFISTIANGDPHVPQTL